MRLGRTEITYLNSSGGGKTSKPTGHSQPLKGLLTGIEPAEADGPCLRKQIGGKKRGYHRHGAILQASRRRKAHSTRRGSEEDGEERKARGVGFHVENYVRGLTARKL